jgi:hypothetical protein
MADTSTVDKTSWEKALDQLTKDREGQYVTIEVVDREYGDQTEAERLPFAYANYDRKDDVVVVGVGGKSGAYPVVLGHMIWHPTEVDVDLAAGAVKVVEPDGTTTFVAFFPDSSKA